MKNVLNEIQSFNFKAWSGTYISIQIIGTKPIVIKEISMVKEIQIEKQYPGFGGPKKSEGGVNNS